MRNLEAKFRISGYDTGWRAINRVAGLPREELRQADRYYQPPPKRAILRQVRFIKPVSDFYYEQIYYQRSKRGNLQISEYNRSRIESPVSLSALKGHPVGLLSSYSTSSTVFTPELIIAKHREVFLVDKTRIHLDFVKRLGCFIEILRPLRDEEDLGNAQSDFWILTKKIGLSPDNIIDESYIDLLMQRS